MTDPTDHRAEAEKWLRFAGTNEDGGNGETLALALIGIGHALLALSDSEPAHDGEDDPFARTMPR